MNNNWTAKVAQVKECTCQHEFQDSRYGKGKRLMNPKKDGFSCSVCGRKHN